MDDQVFQLLNDRLDRIEEKVDKLIAFRSWVLGVGAAMGALASLVVEWFKAH